MPDDTDANQISERVARGFEALVDEEAPAPPPPPPTPPPQPAAGQTSSENSAGAARLDALEARVRQTMDRITELVEAQLPEAVDGLRSDLETLRGELQSTLNEAAQQMADERRQLRSQIATTVGAANRWFVRARDQLNERLDAIADIASEAQTHAEMAAAAVATASTPSAAGSEVAVADVPHGRVAEEERDGEGGRHWEVEAEEDRTPVPAPTTVPASVDLAIDAPELDALMYPVRGDLQELQMEVASLGEAMRDIQAALTRLANRVPARGKGVKLDPEQIELIVEAVMAAVPPPPPAPRARPARPAPPAPVQKATAKRATAEKAPAKKAVTKKKVAAAGKTAAPRKAPTARRTARSFFE